VPDATIELDISTPWEPPDEPAPAPGRAVRRRLAGMVAVLVAAGSVLPAGNASAGLAPLYTADSQILTLDAAGGRLIVTRFRTAGRPPVMQGLDARDGAVLWERPMQADENLVTLTDDVALLQVERGYDDGVYTARLVALDARDGAVRWERDRTRIAGLAAGRVLVEDLAWPEEDRGFDEAYGDPEDPDVALPSLPHHERYVALEAETGRPVWSAESPPGTVASLSYGSYPVVTELTELAADGVLRVRDVATGAVAATHRLDWSGAVARHTAGVAGQEMVWRAGGQAAEVYDRASGRRLWQWTGLEPAFDGPTPCPPGRYCIFDEDGTEVLDAATGAAVWHAPGYTLLYAVTDRRLVLLRQHGDRTKPYDFAGTTSGGRPATPTPSSAASTRTTAAFW
jgi:hypothetical protein